MSEELVFRVRFHSCLQAPTRSLVNMVGLQSGPARFGQCDHHFPIRVAPPFRQLKSQPPRVLDRMNSDHAVLPSHSVHSNSSHTFHTVCPPTD
eukprot:979598_1